VSTDLDPALYDFFTSEHYITALEEVQRRGAAMGIEVGYFDMRQVAGFSYCNYPWNNFYIAWNGLIAPCCAKPFPELLNFGDVQERPLSELINDPALVAFREMSLRNETPSFCVKCHLAAGGPAARDEAPPQ
jgi:radical SAM protein with 4Fe4S-binding SPASM domain